ncbi:MAG: hypothetical protein ACI4TK_01290 [Agathobacter sp.]
MAIKKCRVCGKDYTVCKNAARNPKSKTFRWQEVACSPECGSKYFEQIEMSRNMQATVPEETSVAYVSDVGEETDFNEESVESLFDEAEPNEFGDD